MAFAGSMGAAQAMTPIARLSTPDGATLTYDTDGFTILKQPFNTVTPILYPQINNLRWTLITGQGPNLLVMVAGASVAANADVGALVTGVPSFNEHGIPSNFGPGRGNWVAADLERVRAHVLLYEPDAGNPAFIGMAQVSSLSIGGLGSDLVVFIRNCSLSNVNGLIVELEYRHSINID